MEDNIKIHVNLYRTYAIIRIFYKKEYKVELVTNDEIDSDFFEDILVSIRNSVIELICKGSFLFVPNFNLKIEAFITQSLFPKEDIEETKESMCKFTLDFLKRNFKKFCWIIDE